MIYSTLSSYFIRNVSATITWILWHKYFEFHYGTLDIGPNDTIFSLLLKMFIVFILFILVIFVVTPPDLAECSGDVPRLLWLYIIIIVKYSTCSNIDGAVPSVKQCIAILNMRSLNPPYTLLYELYGCPLMAHWSRSLLPWFWDGHGLSCVWKVCLIYLSLIVMKFIFITKFKHIIIWLLLSLFCCQMSSVKSTIKYKDLFSHLPHQVRTMLVYHSITHCVIQKHHFSFFTII